MPKHLRAAPAALLYQALQQVGTIPMVNLNEVAQVASITCGINYLVIYAVY